MSAKELRGRQVTIGTGERAVVVQVPQKAPLTDAEILENVELDARIDHAIDPYRDVVKLGTDLQKLLREDNANAMKALIRDDLPDPSGQMKLFHVQDGKKAEKKAGPRKRKATPRRRGGPRS